MTAKLHTDGSDMPTPYQFPKSRIVLDSFRRGLAFDLAIMLMSSFDIRRLQADANFQSLRRWLRATRITLHTIPVIICLR